MVHRVDALVYFCSLLVIKQQACSFGTSFKSTVIHDMQGLAVAPSQNRCGFMRIIHVHQSLIVTRIAIHSGTGHDLLTKLAGILLKNGLRDNIERLQHNFVTLKLSSGSGRIPPFIAAVEQNLKEDPKLNNKFNIGIIA